MTERITPAERLQALFEFLHVVRNTPGNYTCWLELKCVPFRHDPRDDNPMSLIDKMVRARREGKQLHTFNAEEVNDKRASDNEERSTSQADALRRAAQILEENDPRGESQWAQQTATDLRDKADELDAPTQP